MLWTVITREIQEYLKSLKFLIGFLLTLVLMTVSTMINLNDFKERQQDYVSAQEEMEEDTFRIQVYRAPQVLSTLVQGKDRNLGNLAEFTYMNIPSKTSGYMGEYASQHHRYVAGFAAVDFAFVVRVVLSLMVIFLTYDAISGEKFHGTLKQALANPLPRDQLLLGKFLGGLFVVLSVLVIAALLSLLIMMLHPAISLGKSEWIRIMGMIGLSALYLICFYALGLFISVVVNRPSIALTVLLQIWIFLIIIYPNLGAIIAENWYKLPSEEEIAQRKVAAFRPYEEEYKKVRKAHHSAIIRGVLPSPEIRIKNVELSARQAEVNHQVDREFSNQLTRQAQLAQTISILSPAVLYDQAMLRYARTGMVEFERFMDGLARYWQKHVELTRLRFQDREAARREKLPAFSYSLETTAQSFVATLPSLLILFLMSAIFFVLAYTSFLEKDVR